MPGCVAPSACCSRTSAMCVEIDRHGRRNQRVFLHHHLLDADTINLFGDPDVGLALRLVERHGGNQRQTSPIEGDALRDLPHPHSELCQRGLLHNAVIHRITLLSGLTLHVVLINIAADQAERCRHLFKLLSSHLKMALSRALVIRNRRWRPP